MSGTVTPVQALPAATITLVRDNEGVVEVFLVRRHARSGFMANAYVFPGGRLDPEDASPGLLARLGSGARERVTLMEDVEGDDTALAHLVAALRETFEESGILLAGPRTSGVFEPEAKWQEELNEGVRSFEALITEEDLELRTDALVYFAHWVTPVFEKRRYSARFFLALAPPGQRGVHDGRETTESIWLTPRAALERHAAGELFVAPPQWQVLQDIQGFESTASLLAWARGLTRVPPIQPHRFALDADLALALPGDPEHPDTPAGDHEGKTRRIVLREGTWRHH